MAAPTPTTTAAAGTASTLTGNIPAVPSTPSAATEQHALSNGEVAPSSGTAGVPGSAGTIVLIHGLWMTPLSWEHWVQHYESKGYQVLTPGYPGIEPGEAGVSKLRADPSPLAGLGIQKVFDHMVDFVSKLPTTPIIMGHSFGGAFAQLLVAAGYGTAGVSINGAAVKGVKALPFKEIRSTFPVVSNPTNNHKAVPITEKQFHFSFTNNLTLEESKPVYDRYSVPVSGHILFEAAFANFSKDAATKYDFANGKRAPLLFIAGGNDNILPHAIQHENYERNAKGSDAVSAYKLFPGRSHFTCGESGWEAVADFALEWAQQPKSGEL